MLDFANSICLSWGGGGGGGGGAMSMKSEAQAQFLTCSRPDSQTLNLVKVIEKSDSDSGRDSNL